MMFSLNTIRHPEAPQCAAGALNQLVHWYGGTLRSVARAYWEGHLVYYPDEYTLVEQVVDKGILAAEGQAYAVDQLREVVREMHRRQT